MKLYFFRITALITISFFPQLQFAQSSSFRKLTVEEGLSNNFVRTIHKDRWGYLWFGTLEGLDRFDGLELRSYTEKFPVPKPSVNCLANDPADGLWVGTESGLFYWDFVADKFEEVRVGEDRLSITSLLLLEKDSVIYIGTSNGIFRIDCNDKKVVEIGAGFAITDGFLFRQGKLLYFASKEGLVEYFPETQRIKVYKQDNLSNSPLNKFSAITQYGNDLIVGTQSKGLFWFNTSDKQFSRFQDIGSNYVLTIQCDESGKNLFVGTDGGGLVVIDMETNDIHVYTHDSANPASLSSNSIYSFFIDEIGRYWIGTYSAGVNFSQGLAGDFKVSEYEGGAFLGQKSIRSLYFEKGGDRFIGTRDGFYVTDPRKRKHAFFNNENSEALRSDIILSFFPFNNDQILIGTYGGGVSLYGKGTEELKAFRPEEDFMSGAVYGFSEDRRGNLWILSLNGIYCLNEQTGQLDHFDENNSAIPDNRLYAIYLDSRDRLWLGSMEGVDVFNISSGIPQLISGNINYPGFKCVSFFEDSSNNIWIATEQGGLYKVSGNLNKMTRYTEEDGLANNSVSAITEYPKGILWISTLKGLSRLDTDNQSFDNFSISDGLPGLVFNPGAVINNACNDGQIWMGNEKGLVHFSPDSVGEREMIQKVQISDFYIEGKAISPGSGRVIERPIEEVSVIRLKGNQNSFGFRFVALNYFSASDNKYFYRLTGQDEKWQGIEGNNQVFFQNLKPGKYRFDVCLAAADGKPDKESLTSLEVDIVPLFYQNPYIVGFLVLMLMTGLSFLIVLIRNLRRKVSEEQKQRREKELREKYESSRLTNERSKEILNSVRSYLIESEAYLNADLKVGDMAKSLDCSAHDISQAINQNLNKSFNEFINSYRLESVKNKMMDPGYSKYTLMALAQNCGFNSKTSFYRIFKKETGQTPAEYLKTMNNKSGQ